MMSMHHEQPLQFAHRAELLGSVRSVLHSVISNIAFASTTAPALAARASHELSTPTNNSHSIQNAHILPISIQSVPMSTQTVPISTQNATTSTPTAPISTPTAPISTPRHAAVPLHRPAFSAEAPVLPPLSPPQQLTSPLPQHTALRTTAIGVKFIHNDDLRLPTTRAVVFRDRSRKSKPRRAAEHTVSISGLQAQLDEMSQKHKRLDRLIDTMLRQRVAQQDLLANAEIAKHAAATNPPVDGGSGFKQLQGQAHVKGVAAKRSATEEQRRKAAVDEHENVQDPWLVHAVAHATSPESARRNHLKIAAAKPTSPTSTRRSPRPPARSGSLEGDDGAEGLQGDIADLFVAERFRSYLKRINARKPLWL